MKILIIRLSSMGDVILATPLFSLLRENYPKANITFVTESSYRQFFNGDPRLSAVVGIERSARQLSPQIQNEQWDKVIDLQNNRRSHALIRSLTTRLSTGRFDKCHLSRYLFLLFRINGYDSSNTVVSRYISAAGELLQGEVTPPLKLFFATEECRKAGEILARGSNDRSRPTLALFPFSAWKNKEWPFHKYIDVGRHFTAKGWNVAVFGGPEDRERSLILRDRIGQHALSLAGSLSLHQCGALLTQCTLSLGNDSGLSHLARACGVKTGIIFGSTTSQFGFFPYGEPSFKVFEEPLFCRPCHAHGGNFCWRMDHRCMNTISSKRVIKELEKM